MSEALASPAPVRLRAPLRSPSPCLSLGPGDVSYHPICISDVSCHSGDPDQVLSEDDLPPEVREPEVHVVDLPPEVRIIDLPPEVRIIDLPPGVNAFDLTPDDRIVDLLPEGRGGGHLNCSYCEPMLGDPVACAGFNLQCVHELSVLFPGGADFFREVTLCLRVLLGRYGSVISNRSPDYINVCSVLLWTNINIWTGRMTPAGVMTCNSVLD